MSDQAARIDLELVAHIVGAYVTKNPIPTADLATLIASVASKMGELGGAPAAIEHQQKPKPAVSIAKSITPDYLICLEDGKPYKTLKRTLSGRYGLTPDEYRAKWGLPKDYPMTAPNYSKARSTLAKEIGLGSNAAKPAKKARAKR
jgi:predicted transcriptional regulator